VTVEVIVTRIVALYAVLETTAKDIVGGHVLHPTPPKPGTIWIRFQIYHYICPGSRCAKFGSNWFRCYGSAHAWKTDFLKLT